MHRLLNKIKRHYHDFTLAPSGIFNSRSNTIRLSIVTGQLAAGGVERVLLNLVSTLPKDKFEICIYVTDFNNNVWKDKFETYAKVIEVGPYVEWANDNYQVRNFLFYSLVKNRTDVLFITNSNDGYLATPHIRKIYRQLFRNIKIFDLLHTHGTPKENDAFLRTSMPANDSIDKRIVITRYLKNYYCNKYPVSKDKVRVIYNGISPEIADQNADGENGKQLIGLDDGEVAITYIGRLQADKSPERLVKLAHVAEKELIEHNARIVIVGDGELRPILEELAKKLNVSDRVLTFIGFSDRPLEIMAASRFTILTSNLEGLPMSILESMSAGTPAIAPGVGGIPEIITPDKDGLLVEFEALEEDEKINNLAKAIHTALNLTPDQYEEMRNESKRKVQHKFMNMDTEYSKLFEGKS